MNDDARSAGDARVVVGSAPRLVLDELIAADAPFILELLTDAAFLANIGERGVHDLASACDYVARTRLGYREHGFGLWRMRLQRCGTPAGLCGLVRRAELPGPDIGFALLPRHRGQGLATEAAILTLAIARRLGVPPPVYAVVKPHNTASIAVLTKLGMQHEDTRRLTPMGELLQIHRLDRFD